MQIHNFFSDVLLSTRILFDDIIFQPDFIKSYSFNVANKSFELKRKEYKTQYEFPAAIIKLMDDRYSFGERTNVVQHHSIENWNQIPVLVDAITHNVIYLQEEHTTINLQAQINCESQFQAKEIDFRIKRYLPLDKYISILDFISFLEISPVYLTSLGFNYNDNKVHNLFTKLNKNQGRIEYCFSVKYQPLIKLESIDSNISDSTQRSFTVNVNLSYLMQMPMWLCYDTGKGEITNINIDFKRFGQEPVAKDMNKSIINNEKEGVLLSLVVQDLNDFELSELSSGEGYIFSLQLPEDDFEFKKSQRFDIFDITNTLHKDIEPILVDTDSNEVRFEFSNDQFKKFNATITSPIIIQIRKLEDE